MAIAKKDEKTKAKKPETKTEKPAKKAEPKKTAPKAEPEKKVVENKIYHITKRKEDGKWQVKFGGGEKAIKLFDTQAEAIAYAKKLAESQDGSISIHKVDGKTRKQNYNK